MDRDPTRRVEPSMPDWQRRRRAKILDAALELLEADDYDSIQMRDVAGRAGFAASTLYRYFSSKEHLYAEVMRDWSGAFPVSLRRRPLRGSPPDRLKEVARRVIRAFEHRRQFLRLEMVLETSVDEDAVRVLRQVGGERRANFLEALSDIDPDVAGRIIDVVTSVLSIQLRQYAVGHIPLSLVNQRANSAIDLIFSPGPTGDAFSVRSRRSAGVALDRRGISV